MPSPTGLAGNTCATELVNYLHFALTGEGVSAEHPAGRRLPGCGDRRPRAVARRHAAPGRRSSRFICCVAIEGFPAESFPGILDALDHLPIPYRWSTRMIYLDQHETLAELRKFRRKWKQQVRGFWTQVFKTQGGSVNEDALLMAGPGGCGHRRCQLGPGRVRLLHARHRADGPGSRRR